MALKGSPTARSAALVRLVRIVGIVVAICMFFGIADSGVSWAATPAIRSIRAIKKGASSFFALEGLAVNPETNTVYTTDGLELFVINGATDKVTDQLFVSGLMTVNPATNTVYVNNGKAVSVINGATDKVTSTLHVKSAGIGFAVNQTTNTVYSSDGDFVSAISFGNPSHSVVSGDSIWLAVVGLVVVGGGSALINVSKRRRLDAQQADEDGTPPQRYQRRR